MTYLLLALSAKAMAPDIRTLTIVVPAPVDIYERLLAAVMQVESAGDTLAYNPLEDAYGPLQIRPIRLLDYNRRTGKTYVMRDCYRPVISKEIFLYYAVLLGPDFEIIAKRWNGSGVKTIDYWARVKTVLNNAELENAGKMPG
jgi:hypothetical protein